MPSDKDNLPTPLHIRRIGQTGDGRPLLLCDRHAAWLMPGEPTTDEECAAILKEPPSKAAAETVRREAHGLAADEIIEVHEGT